MQVDRTITIEMLESIFAKIIEKLKLDKSPTIDIDYDYYRIITSDVWQNFDKEEIVTGSLIDDFDSLKKAISSDGVFTFVDFDRTSSILRFISEKLNPVSG